MGAGAVGTDVHAPRAAAARPLSRIPGVVDRAPRDLLDPLRIDTGGLPDPEPGKVPLLAAGVQPDSRVLRTQGVAVKSYAKPGCTAADAVRMLDKAEPLPGAPCVIEFGGNDSDLNWEEVAAQPDLPHEAKVSLSDFHDSLLRLIAYARDNGMRPVVSIPLPVVPDRYFEWVSQKLDRDAILHYLQPGVHLSLAGALRLCSPQNGQRSQLPHL